MGEGTREPWPRSADVLNHLVTTRISSTIRILRGQVRAFTANFPEWRLNRAARDEWAGRAAVLVVLRLISGRCECGHHVKACRPHVRCRCCLRGHALQGWNGEMSLAQFVSTAVHGSPHQTNAVWGDVFARSMLRPVLDGAGLEPMVIGDAEARRCAACGLRFDAEVCPCGAPDDVTVNRREVVRHVLLYPDAGGYRKVRRVLCRDCGGYFDTGRVDRGEGCPLVGCGSKRQMRCGTRGCGRWRDVDAVHEPCEGCGEALTASSDEAFNERRLRLCRAPEVWVR